LAVVDMWMKYLVPVAVMEDEVLVLNNGGGGAGIGGGECE